MPRRPRGYRAMLECRDADGKKSGGFYFVGDILLSPDLQARCCEKRALKRILEAIEDNPSVAKSIQDVKQDSLRREEEWEANWKARRQTKGRVR